jgi:acetyl-CoA synthetase
MVRSFQWNIPEHFNIGEAVSGFWAKHDPDRLAIIDEREDGSVREWSFLALDRLANRFANALIASGARVGDRVGIHLPQRVETAAAHLGAFKAGVNHHPAV